MKIRSILAGALLLCFANSYAQDATPILLYTNGVPNSKKGPDTYVERDVNGSVSKVIEPTLIPFIPEKGTANGTAVIICPGGGYSGLAMRGEGFPAAKEFNKIGVTAFVLKYRLPSDDIMVDKTIGPLQDAQAAMVLVRSRAAEWGLNPARIGIMGFSAGGHLASTAGTHFDKPAIDNKGVNLRPDFMILIYPVITFGELTHGGSKRNLIGTTPTQDKVDLYSNEKQVTASTPMTFIIHAQDDTTVPVQNTLMFFDALVKNKVPSEMHIYPAGGHGFGINNRKSKENWFDWCKGWMDTNGLLTAAK
ncbi:alpha/beta hydrolase [Mucilaginibacter calamicampi]|uniref:Alpha/beta hydrolase n=1 Tax=Mucilaginibacter calamicampi TaxID=1302352 RepID=A0ABW2YTP2_9SPHI